MKQVQSLIAPADKYEAGFGSLLTRADGFFGEPVPTLDEGLGIPDLRPAALLAATDDTN